MRLAPWLPVCEQGGVLVATEMQMGTPNRGRMLVPSSLLGPLPPPLPLHGLILLPAGATVTIYKRIISRFSRRHL
jgi:hypothetical protein